MSSMLSSQGMVLATAMAAVSGTVIFLATFRLQKSPYSLPCIISSEEEGKKKEKKKKKVQFAEDVVDPIGNSDEYRKLHSNNNKAHHHPKPDISINKGGKVRQMPANRVALYNGMLRDRVIHRVAYSH